MARPPRLVVPGYPHHLIQRGNNRQPIFLDDVDRRQFLDALREVSRTHGVAVHAYVLMGNHVHLLATPEDADGLSRMMQSLGRRYVAWFNHRHQRTGTLWEGRFKLSVVDSDAYFLSCQRYIELNPHRAGLASGWLDHPWSSLAHHIGGPPDPLVLDHPAYWQLGNTPFEREAAYKEWLAQGVDETEQRRITAALAQGGVLGDAAFAQRLGTIMQRDVVPRPRGRPRKPSTKLEK